MKPSVALTATGRGAESTALLSRLRAVFVVASRGGKMQVWFGAYARKSGDIARGDGARGNGVEGKVGRGFHRRA